MKLWKLGEYNFSDKRPTLRLSLLWMNNTLQYQILQFTVNKQQLKNGAFDEVLYSHMMKYCSILDEHGTIATT